VDCIRRRVCIRITRRLQLGPLGRQGREGHEDTSARVNIGEAMTNRHIVVLIIFVLALIISMFLAEDCSSHIHTGSGYP